MEGVDARPGPHINQLGRLIQRHNQNEIRIVRVKCGITNSLLRDEAKFVGGRALNHVQQTEQRVSEPAEDTGVVLMGGQLKEEQFGRSFCKKNQYSHFADFQSIKLRTSFSQNYRFGLSSVFK